MQRRKFSREFKLEAVRLVRERGVAVAQAAIELLLMTGARLNEILRARWEYVDYDQSSLLVPLSKSGKVASVKVV